jgi:hypothetical protein
MLSRLFLPVYVQLSLGQIKISIKKMLEGERWRAGGHISRPVERNWGNCVFYPCRQVQLYFYPPFFNFVILPRDFKMKK